MKERKSVKYDNEVKLRAVKLCLESDKPDIKIAEELGIKPTTLATWKSKYLKNQEKAFSSKDNLTAEQKEIISLKKELRSVSIQRVILKKALAIFSQEK